MVSRARTLQELELARDAKAALESGNFKRVVTNANVAPDTKLITGVSARLASLGIELIDVMSTSATDAPREKGPSRLA
jgi:hypothetical protein